MAGNERYIQEEIQRMEARSAKTLQEATQQLASLKLSGMARKEQGPVAPTILKGAPKRDGLRAPCAVVGRREKRNYSSKACKS